MAEPEIQLAVGRPPTQDQPRCPAVRSCLLLELQPNPNAAIPAPETWCEHDRRNRVPSDVAATQATRSGTVAAAERLTRWHIIGTAGGDRQGVNPFDLVI